MIFPDKLSRAERTLLDSVLVRSVSEFHWMARRWADGKSGDYTLRFNNLVRELLTIGLKVDPKSEGTIWVRDSMGREYDGLSAKEAAVGSKPDTDWLKDCRQIIESEQVREILIIENETLRKEIARLKLRVKKLSAKDTVPPTKKRK